MTGNISTWERSRYKAGEARALIHYTVYGEFTDDGVMSGSKYRSAGLPDGFTMTKVSRKEHAPLPFTEPEFVKVLQDAALAVRIQQAPECLVVHGEMVDPPDLNYLRDVIGMVMFTLDHGGFAVCDPQQFELYDSERWQRDIFEPGRANLIKHVKVLYSEEEIGSADHLWFHTRGLRKFARPDLSIRHVPRESSAVVIDLCNRFIELQALGGQIPEGQEIRMASLPPGLICHHAGTLDDPEFNNVHVEMVWPNR